MINYRVIFFVIGFLLCLLSAAMLVPAALDYYYGDISYSYFLQSFVVTLFFGVSLIISNRTDINTVTDINIKTAFLVTSLIWLIIPIFAAFPFLFSHTGYGFTDAIFETVSGLTTTGASIIPDVEVISKGILLWRAILHWLGGIGIIVMAMSVLPLLKIGGMQLFRMESSDKMEKFLPKSTQIAATTFLVYTVLTIFFVILLKEVSKISWFDAVNHVFAAISTGGFSFYNNSVAHFDSISVEIILIATMIAGALPFNLYAISIISKFEFFYKDTQVRFFLAALLLAVVLTTMWLTLNKGWEFSEALRKAGFNIISIMTCCGFATEDFSQWGGFALLIFFLVCIFGGCTGSSSGGMKAFRVYVLFEMCRNYIFTLIRPHGVYRTKFNGKIINQEESNSIVIFAILYILVLFLSALMLSFSGLDFLASISSSAAMLANSGPALAQDLGPIGNFSGISDYAKWVCTITMLLGRLELFALLVIITPAFWRS